ncbi:ABC transporter permease [Planosporangium mesophilum]|uniref:ABC transporter permease n=1 Tax=Planosporangium mesophilum TaxID=689768 RepID=A0A8J3TDR7_9ACTN|nr:ABC transporter permease [Planosporangium mesophilum]GII22949.1 ABC transporter permease [Planosporangium mesophilum]
MTGGTMTDDPTTGEHLSGGPTTGGGLVRGIALVTRHEFRVRLRTGRWRWLLGAWVAVIAVFTGLLHSALAVTETEPGIPLFGGLMLFVLALVLIISPALTAQSINGDRERGTLATLQVTRLSAAQIALGKLLAGWGVGLTALVLTVPFVGWAMLQGGVGGLRALVVMVVVALLIGVVCAVSQALSALVARSITSALLSYVTVFALTVGTLVAFGLALPLTAEKVQQSTFDGQEYTTSRVRTERVWWLLAPNPFAVLADAAPRLPRPVDPYTGQPEPVPFDPLGEVGHEVRRLRVPSTPGGPEAPVPVPETESGPVWPYGLAFDLLLGVGAGWLTVRRLRTPARTLAKGVRVA